MPLPLIPFMVGVPLSVGVWGIVQHIISQDWPKLRNMFFFPLGGTTRPHHAVQRQRVLRRLRGVQVRLVTRDQRVITAVWAEPQEASQEDAGVLLLGANAMVLDDLLEYAEWYLHRLRVPVLLVNLWSYPDPANPPHAQLAAAKASKVAAGGGGGKGGEGRKPAHGASVSAAEPNPTANPSVTTPLMAGGPAAAGAHSGSGAAASADAAPVLVPTELTAYLDGEAAFAYLTSERGLASERVLVHGVSIGGAVGAAVALNHPGVRLTLDQPFCTLKEVTRNMAQQVVDGLVSKWLTAKRWACVVPAARVCIAPPLASTASFMLVRMCFKRGLGGDGAGCAKTDLFDNVHKARSIQGEVFVIRARDDEMMHPDAARRILSARYAPKGAAAADELVAQRSVEIAGGHMGFFGDDPAACAHYVELLRRDGFLRAALGMAEAGQLERAEGR